MNCLRGSPARVAAPYNGHMDKRLLCAVAAVAAALILPACSNTSAPAPSASEPKKEEPAKPPEPITGKAAYSSMYQSARAWAPDLMLLSLVAGEVPGFKNEEGKAALWTAVFVSPARHEARTVTYAIAGSDSTSKGVGSGPAQSWGGAIPSAKPFSSSDFPVDSDLAYKAAMERAGAWVKGHPGKKLTLSLSSSSRFPAPMWGFLWGDKKSGYLAYVNAVSGKVQK